MSEYFKLTLFSIILFCLLATLIVYWMARTSIVTTELYIPDNTFDPKNKKTKNHIFADVAITSFLLLAFIVVFRNIFTKHILCSVKK